MTSTRRTWGVFVLLGLFYLGGLWQRPVFEAEYPFVLWARSHWKMSFAQEAVAARLPSVAATLLTAWLLYLFLRRRDKETGVMAAAVFLASGNVFIAGTAADQAAFFTLGSTLLLLSATKLRTERKGLFLPGLAAGGGILWYAVKFMPLPAFHPEYTPWFLLGFFPLFLLAPLLFSGARKLDFREPEIQLGCAGFLAGIAGIFIGEFTAAMPFAALLAAAALKRYGEQDVLLERMDKLLKHWTKLFLTAGILLLAGVLLVRFGKIKPFPLPGNPVVCGFSAIVLLLWFFMAQKETLLPVKTAYFCLGAAFFCGAVPAMIPARTLAAAAPANVFLRGWRGALPGEKVFAVPEAEALLRYTGKAGDLTVLPAENLASVFREKQPLFVILRDKAEVSLFPPSNRKQVIPPVRVIILEYDQP